MQDRPPITAAGAERLRAELERLRNEERPRVIRAISEAREHGICARTRNIGARRGAATTPVLVGFAAETGDAVEHAREKLARKRVDLIVANDVTTPGAGFAVDTNVATLVSESGVEPLSKRSKRDVARAILDYVDARLGKRTEPARRQESAP